MQQHYQPLQNHLPQKNHRKEALRLIPSSHYLHNNAVCVWHGLDEQHFFVVENICHDFYPFDRCHIKSLLTGGGSRSHPRRSAYSSVLGASPSSSKKPSKAALLSPSASSQSPSVSSSSRCRSGITVKRLRKGDTDKRITRSYCSLNKNAAAVLLTCNKYCRGNREEKYDQERDDRESHKSEVNGREVLHPVDLNKQHNRHV